VASTTTQPESVAIRLLRSVAMLLRHTTACSSSSLVLDKPTTKSSCSTALAKPPCGVRGFSSPNLHRSLNGIKVTLTPSGKASRIIRPLARNRCRRGRPLRCLAGIGVEIWHWGAALSAPLGPGCGGQHSSSAAEADVSNRLSNSRVQVYCLDEHPPTAR
jgi:hypothetical protein